MKHMIATSERRRSPEFLIEATDAPDENGHIAVTVKDLFTAGAGIYVFEYDAAQDMIDSQLQVDFLVCQNFISSCVATSKFDQFSKNTLVRVMINSDGSRVFLLTNPDASIELFMTINEKTDSDRPNLWNITVIDAPKAGR